MSAGKVLLVSHHAEIIGGGEISLLTLIKGLVGTAWEPGLVVPGPGEVSDRCRALGVDVHDVPMPSLRAPGLGALSAIRRMRKLIAGSGCTLLHANGSRAMFYAGSAARTMGRPAIWHLRVLDADPRFDPVLARLATASVAISGRVRERLKPWSAAYQRCRVIPNGLDLDTFVPRRRESSTRASLNVADDDFVVTTVGRLVDFKAHDVLLEAIALLRPAAADMKCVIVGDGPEMTALHDRSSRADLAGAVEFAGHREDIPDVLAASDVFVLPSPAEHFGRVLIEAMAVEIPVVACDAAGPAEIVESEATGILVAPRSAAALAAAIARLHEDRQLGARLAAAAHRSVVERYSMQEHARRITEFYANVVGGDY